MDNNFIIKGDINNSNKAVIFIHGRGATAQDILNLAAYFPVSRYYLIAPQAPNNTWYPYSFMAKIEDNEPYLSNSLATLDKIVKELENNGVNHENIYFIGFSQGACLTLDYTARNAKKYGGILAFTGGLIGEKLDLKNYTGDFNSTPIYIGSSNPDQHVPVSRVQESTTLLTNMGALVKEEIFDYMGHTITKEEIDSAKSFIFK